MAFYAPDPIQSTQLIPGGNVPAAGGLLFVYVPGTTTKQDSFTDSSASTARTNPIVLDSGGNIPGNGEVWIASTAKFVLAPSTDADPPTSPYWTRDYLPGINNVTSVSGTLTGEWVTGSTATFVGVTQFTLTGDQTALYTLGRRVRATVTGGDRFGSVTSSAFATGSTTIGLLLDSGTLNAGLSAVSYGILSTPNGSIPWETITSSGTGRQARIDFYNVSYNSAYNVVSSGGASPNIWGQGNVLDYSNTTAASTFSNAPQAGATRTLIITSSTSFNSSAALNLGTATFNMSAGDALDVIATSTNAFSAYRKSLGGSALELISSLTVNSTSNVVFNSTQITSRFGEYELHIHRMFPSSTNAVPNLRVSSSDGTSWETSYAYVGDVINAAGGGGNFIQGVNGTTEILIANSTGIVNTVGSGYYGRLNFFNLNDTSGTLKSILFESWGTTIRVDGGGSPLTVGSGSSSINALQIRFGSGNISTGSFYLYGLRTT